MGRNVRLALALLAATPLAALAQVPPTAGPPTAGPPTAGPPTQLPPAAEPGRPTPGPAPAARPPQARLSFSFPAQRPGAAGTRSADALKFTLREIRVEGATLVGPAETDPILQPLLNTPITLAEVTQAAEQIQAIYTARGYVLSRVYVPPQEIENATMRIAVLEGYLGAVRVEDAPPEVAAHIEALAGPALAERPGSVEAIERALLLASDLPGVTIGGVLRPGERPGEAELIVATGYKPVVVTFGAGNRGSDFTGPWTGFADLALNGYAGLGEQIGITVNGTGAPEERFGVSGRLRLPIGDAGLAALFTGSYSEGRPGAALKEFNVETEGRSLGARLSYPLARSRDENLTIEAALTWNRNTVEILGVPFTEDQYSFVEARGTYAQNGFLGGGTVVSVGVVQGLDLFGATDDQSDSASRLGAKPDFLKFEAELERVQPLGETFSLSVAAGAQYSTDPLFAGEEFTLGGSRFGRGYNDADLAGRNGVGVAAELRAAFETGLELPDVVVPYAFYDWGSVSGSQIANADLSSAGAGVRVSLGAGRLLTLEVARALDTLPVAGAQPEGTYLFAEFVASF